MGTRNLTCVYMNGEYKVAQYGHWDGYPEVLGVTILTFLKSVNMESFKDAVSKVSFLTKANRKLMPDYDWTKDGEILNRIVFDGVTKVENSIDFAKDSRLCEWAYVIDLDTNKFEVYRGFNKEPLSASDRFYFNGETAEDSDGYYPIKKIADFYLNNLPIEEDFLWMVEDEDE